MVVYEQCQDEDCSAWKGCVNCVTCGAPPRYFSRTCVACKECECRQPDYTLSKMVI